MGCVKSSNANEDEGGAPNRVRKPRPWRHDDPNPLTSDQLREMRNVFWRTAPCYGGRPEIWQALRTAAQSDIFYAQAIINANHITLGNPDMTVCFDETGERYDLPLYVLSDPSNMAGNIDTTAPARRPSMMDRLRRRA